MKPLLLAFSIFALFGCAVTPVSDLAPGERPELDSDEAGLWQAMERDEFTLRTSPSVIREPQLQQYLESILCRVSPEYCEEIRIYVVPSPQFNAAMGPNGMMLIFTGLLLRVENEAQLAAIMGHEVAHFQRRHSVQQLRTIRARLAGLQTLASVVSAGTYVAAVNANAALAAGDVSSAVAQAQTAQQIANVGGALVSSLSIWTILSQLEYSREHETESDELGLDSLAASGYDPSVVADLWAYMKQEDELSNSLVPGYLRTHPLPENRMTRNQQRAAELMTEFPDSRATGSGAYLETVSQHRHDWLSSARVSLDRDLEEMLLERQRFLGVDPGLILFHEADMHRKHDEAQGPELALETYRRAIEHASVPPEAYREMGLLLWDEGEIREARNAFQEYLALAPAASDAQLIQSYIEELSE